MQLIEEGDDTNIVIDLNISGAPEYVRRYLGRRRVDHLDLLYFQWHRSRPRRRGRVPGADPQGGDRQDR